MAHRLFDESLRPAEAPEPYRRARDVVRIAEATTGPVVAEIAQRKDGTFGFRFLACVAWRDAGGGVQAHAWHEVVQLTGIVESADEAQQLASSVTSSKGLELASWRAAA